MTAPYRAPGMFGMQPPTLHAKFAEKAITPLRCSRSSHLARKETKYACWPKDAM